MSDPKAGFREHEHTSDRELEIWAPNFTQLLEQAALGMNTLAGIRLGSGVRVARMFSITFNDLEQALVSFLEELLFITDTEYIAFDEFDIKVSSNNIDVNAFGTEILTISKEIKAVTYHNLAVLRAQSGLCVRIVFDV
jgi:SHS2 domain-containing protein